MKLARRLLLYASAGAVVLGSAARALADCEIPLAIGTTNGGANVLILMDTSISMNAAVFAQAYNPATNYSGSFARTTTYSIDSTRTYTPRDFNRRWATTPSATLVRSDAGWAGDYDGNYLNWIYFNATAAQRAAIPVVTRIQAAKQVVNATLASVTGCRFAVEVFNGTNGGRIIAPFGTSIASMQTQVSAAQADSWTPLAESMVTALNYFARSDTTAPIQAACEKSFIICVTDGMPTSDTTVPNYITDSDRNGYYLDNVAAYLYLNDLRNVLDDIQNVATFTIGFSVDATATTLLQLTAEEGGGAYFGVSDAASLQDALTANFNTIAARIAAGSAVSVVSSEDRTDRRLYRARYESGTWKGFVEAYGLPYHSGASPVWEAGALLAAADPDTRIVLTSTGGSVVDLSTANAGLLTTDLGAADASEAANIIRYARGTDVGGSRDRAGWKLGDVVDAAPAAVGRPSGFNDILDYSAFRAAHTDRPEVVYVAANDGMLHCFDAGTGAESWAYVPNNQLPKLRDLMDPAYCHSYFLNLTPVPFDIYFNGAWQTVLVGGDAQGGSGLYALDITSPDPDSVSVLWDQDMSFLKGTWNTPALVRDYNRDAYVLVVGTGYEAASGQASLYVVDPADGSALDSLDLGSPAAGNKATKATVVDRDFDGYDDLLYLGDLAGNVWRIDLTTDPWTVHCLFSCGQPIQSGLVATLDEYDRPMVFFGTGRYITAADPPDTSPQTIYGLIDAGSDTTITPSDLVDQTSTFTPISGEPGWSIDLVQQLGERVIRTPALIAGTVYVPSFSPNSAACVGGGQSWLYRIDYKDGSAPDHPGGAPNDTTGGRVESMGDGILSDPSVDIVDEQLLLQSSNGVLLAQDISLSLKKLVIRSWRQKWN